VRKGQETVDSSDRFDKFIEQARKALSLAQERESSRLEVGPLIRLFISSTFSDFVFERDVLQRTVFPHLRALCSAQGCSGKVVPGIA
jgi:hypothetical protein